MVESPAIKAVERLGIEHRVVQTRPANSAEESAELQGIELGALLRTLVVRRGEDDYLFVLVPGGRRFDWPKLRAHLGVKRMTMPDAEEARAVTGYERGAITPFGATRAWPVLIDAAALERPLVAIGGGDARRQPAPRAGRPGEAPRRGGRRRVGDGTGGRMTRQVGTRTAVAFALGGPGGVLRRRPDHDEAEVTTMELTSGSFDDGGVDPEPSTRAMARTSRRRSPGARSPTGPSPSR